MDPSLAPPHVPCTIRAEQTHLRIPSRPEWIDATAAFLEQKAVLCGACPGDRRERLFAALREALSNAILRGNLELCADLQARGGDAFAQTLATRADDPRYAGRFVDIEIVYNGQRCDWVFTQEGPGFDVKRVLGGEAECRGILLMRALVDEVRYAAGGRQLALSLRKRGCPEKRRTERTSVHARARVAAARAGDPAGWDPAHEAIVRDVSGGGLRLLQGRPAAAEQVLVSVEAGGELLHVPAEVRHSRRLGEGEVEVGCRFGAAANTAAVVAALSKRPAPRPDESAERRAQPRFAYTERLLVHGEAGPVPGHGRDLSRGGIGFLSVGPVPAGPCVLELPQSGERPVRLRARVLRCEPVAGRFHDVGARLVGPDPQPVIAAGRPGS